MNTLTFNSYAKLNLYLSVRRKRRDNFHSIDTVFERISLCDRIVLRERADSRIVLTCSDPRLPSGGDNLAVKAAAALSRKYAPGKGVTIELTKRIPAGAGLGGGSSNAAAVLRGLNKLWKLCLPVAALGKLAAEIGSDVAFFVHNCRFARATGKGERIQPLPALSKRVLWHVVVVPDAHVATPRIYQHWDKLRASKNIAISWLTRPASDAKLILLALTRRRVRYPVYPLFNSLEAVTADLYPAMRTVRQALAAAGIKNILMSGSGSAFFGIVSSRKEAEDLSRQLRKRHRLWHVFVATTV